MLIRSSRCGMHLHDLFAPTKVKIMRILPQGKTRTVPPVTSLTSQTIVYSLAPANTVRWLLLFVLLHWVVWFLVLANQLSCWSALSNIFCLHSPLATKCGASCGLLSPPIFWYVSNIYIIFDCFMLLYYQFWVFYIHLLATLYHFWD